MNIQRGLLLATALLASQSLATPQTESALPAWQDPTVFRINKLPSRSFFYSYRSAEEVNTTNPFQSSNHLLLNGEWQFNWVENPQSKIEGFEHNDFDDSQWDTIPVPANWEINGYGIPYYHSHNCFAPNVTPPELPQTYNPVGQYRKQFTLPDTWQNERVVAHFGAVKSAFYVYVNGQRVGYSEDSKTQAEFDITDYLKAGDNTLALEVYRYSDGSYFECQDMWRLSGIERDVYLFATPKVHIADYHSEATLSADFEDGILNLSTRIANVDSGTHRDLALKVSVSDNGETLAEELLTMGSLSSDSEQTINWQLTLADIEAWSAERPKLYQLDLTLLADDQAIEYVSNRIGFRSSELRNGQFLINGQPVLFKGVNRHEHDPVTGHVVSRESMELDARLMKENNINSVRLAHYPNDPYWYQLADEVGLYLVDEANIESHGLGAANQGAGYNPANHIVNQPDWRDAYIDRIENMYQRSKNNPSVVIRSLGNETGDGPNTEASYDWLKQASDEPVISEQAQLRRHTDAYGQMYASIDQITHYAETQVDSRPAILIEYEHAMGNSLGNFKEYWDTFKQYDSLQGGFIWDWVDQTFLRHTPQGEAFWAYGGDLEPPAVIHSDSFCANGLVYADRSAYPYLHEVKRVQQDIAIEFDEASKQLSVSNEFFFIDLAGYELSWELIANGQVVAQSLQNIPLSAAAQHTQTIALNELELDQFSGELFLNTSVQLAAAQGMLNAGHIAAQSQHALSSAFTPPLADQATRLRLRENDERFRLSSNVADIQFNKDSGLLTQVSYHGEEILAGSSRPEFWRAPIDNDFDISKFQPSLSTWQWVGRSMTLQSIDVTRIDSQRVKVSTVHNLPSVQSQYLSEYIVHGNGRIDFDLWFYAAPHQKQAELPRFGTLFQLNPALSQVAWYGRGPHENYSDRKTSADVGRYQSTVEDLYTPYVRPQENGYRTDVRTLHFSDDNQRGVSFLGAPLLSFGAQYYSTDDYDASKGQVSARNLHPHDLQKQDRIFVNIDLRQRGVGGTDSWGSPPLFRYTLPWLDYRYQFTMQPLNDIDQ
ncbi:glycoside hydrolase family 2 TIM barrel-domain containing protein [Umboniibacter marinipuniceus]|uniref:beta-galactosidase n=1 Tax=Umboniibacter marinipuniceus TaxID=569599 RepID=A0A3M0AHZ8_9GAMM|nr:glycoside hydrolase family 2 TIM barrel-domain containing protein [Umboniibacter marinipuniceus]RMA78832.1 beta-galactosidase [Umboniibacter marinipuniceus]